jgi:hypothetical protein
MLDAIERAARQNIPAGYAVVKDGPVLPDDLLFSYPGGGFMRADSPDWSTSVVTDAADAILCIRRPGLDMPGAARRTYTIPATPAPALSDRQQKLW